MLRRPDVSRALRPVRLGQVCLPRSFCYVGLAYVRFGFGLGRRRAFGDDRLGHAFTTRPAAAVAVARGIAISSTSPCSGSLVGCSPATACAGRGDKRLDPTSGCTGPRNVPVASAVLMSRRTRRHRLAAAAGTVFRSEMTSSLGSGLDSSLGTGLVSGAG